MGARKQLQRLHALSIVMTAALGCGGNASVNTPAPQQQGTANGTASLPSDNAEGNAPSLVVPMSMVIPKKTVTPPAPSTPPATQAPQGMGGFPPAGTTPPGAGAPTAPTTGVPGMAPGAGAAGAAAPTTPPATGAMMAGAAGAAAPAAGSGMAKGFEIAGVPEAELSMLRDLCVSEINMYRATLTDRMLKPITRATPEQEECSEKGAKMDGDTMSAHGAARAGLCSSLGLSSENTCPGYPVGAGGFGGGSGTIADALKFCLKQMWAEGEPPVSRAECQQDYQGCFLKHGHYLNMSDPNIATVACSFYKMMDGRSYWMNQDFTINWSGGGWPRMQ